MMLEEMQEREAAEARARAKERAEVLARQIKEKGALDAMRSHAKKPRNEGGMGQKPGLPCRGDNNQQAQAGKVSTRKAAIVAFVEKYPGTTRAAITSSIKGCTDNDFANLRMAGRIHSQWNEGMWRYHPGPKPEVTG